MRFICKRCKRNIRTLSDNWKSPYCSECACKLVIENVSNHSNLKIAKILAKLKI